MAVVSGSYVMASFISLGLIMQVQQVFFDSMYPVTSLLYLPHGVRVLAAWLLGWRSVPALMPGVFAGYAYYLGWDVFSLYWILKISILCTLPAAVFHGLRLFGMDLRPQTGKAPCWACIAAAGLLVSLLGSALSMLTSDDPLTGYFGYVIGDFFGLFFLCLLLMFAFRCMRKAGI